MIHADNNEDENTLNAPATTAFGLWVSFFAEKFRSFDPSP